jgi:NAD(P)H-quinone oxidoreductase subunit 4
MSGFVAELMVFVGFATSDAYSFTFRLITVLLMAIGVILTPIYLLSMLREIFYGPENKALVEHEVLVDAEPREVFIIACLLVPIIGFGFYPKLLTQIYDATTQSLNLRLNQVFVASQNTGEGTVPVAALPVLKAPTISQ